MSRELDDLAQVLGARLMAQRAVLATAESCTGGLVAASVTAVPGSSAWFERGFVTYDNQAKIDDLGVSSQTLTEFGAVSEQVAQEMALGALRASRTATHAVSTTGIAGPDRGNSSKPVGMVCFGWAWKVDGVEHARTETHHFDGDRTAVRVASVQVALAGVLPPA